jgi:hypothetical protein
VRHRWWAGAGQGRRPRGQVEVPGQEPGEGGPFGVGEVRLDGSERLGVN